MKQPNALFVLLIILAVSCAESPRQPIMPGDNRQHDKLIRVNKYLVEKDADRIRGYCKRMGWNLNISNTGLWYEIYSHGTGKKASPGKIVHLNYKVTLLDGTLCYSSDSLGEKKFKIGKGEVESGLDEGVQLLHEGDKAHFILPPHLAFGIHGDDNRIPIRSIIVYEVTLTKIDE